MRASHHELLVFGVPTVLHACGDGGAQAARAGRAEPHPHRHRVPRSLACAALRCLTTRNQRRARGQGRRPGGGARGGPRRRPRPSRASAQSGQPPPGRRWSLSRFPGESACASLRPWARPCVRSATPRRFSGPQRLPAPLRSRPGPCSHFPPGGALWPRGSLDAGAPGSLAPLLSCLPAYLSVCLLESPEWWLAALFPWALHALRPRLVSSLCLQ